MRPRLLLPACIMAVVVPALARPAPAEDKPSYGQSQVLHVAAGEVGIDGVCLVSRDRVPVACFGLHKVGGKTRYTYLIVFRADAKSGSGVESEVKGGFGTSGADVKVSAKVTKKKFDVAYELKADHATGTVSKEVLTVAGKEYAKDLPRVFLVDLTGEKVTCEPLKIAAPADAPDVADDDKPAAVERTIARLKEKSPDVKRFLDGEPAKK